MRSSTLLSILLACGFVMLINATPAAAEVINVDTGAILFYDNFESQPADKVSHAAYPDVKDAMPTGSGIIGGGSYYFSQITGGEPVLTNIQVADYVSGTAYPAAYEGNNSLRLRKQGDFFRSFAAGIINFFLAICHVFNVFFECYILVFLNGFKNH